MPARGDTEARHRRVAPTRGRARARRGCAAAACDCGVWNGARSRRALATQAGALQRARALRVGEMAHLACAVRRLPGDAPPGGSVVGPGSRQTGCLCESDARGTVCGREARRTRSCTFNLAPKPAVNTASYSHLVHLSDAGTPAHSARADGQCTQGLSRQREGIAASAHRARARAARWPHRLASRAACTQAPGRRIDRDGTRSNSI